MSRTPTHGEVLNRLGEIVGARLRVCLPGKVTKWDSSKQLAEVVPLLQEFKENPDGTVTNFELKPISNVKLFCLGAGGMRITLPVKVGDTGILIFSDRSLDEWLANGGSVAPQDTRRHNLTDAFFVPGATPNNAPWAWDDNVITIGSDSGSADYVALAQKTLDQLNSIVNGINGHTHQLTGTDSNGDSLSPGGATLTPTTPLASPSSVASATVKVKG